MKSKKFTTEIGGRTLTAEFTNYAEHANGSCIVTYGETVVMATAVQGKTPREGVDFFPLTVDYEEKFYAAGRILGSRFMRREGRSSDNAILVSRLIDRTIRPLFSSKTRNEVQVIVLALSIDEDNDPDVCAILAASLALGTSDIPWGGPIGAVRIGKSNGGFTVDTPVESGFIINPTYKERESASLDAVICGKDGKINMIEAGAGELPEAAMGEVLEIASKEIEKLTAFQKGIIAEIGKAKAKIALAEASEEMRKQFKSAFHERVAEAIYIKEKMLRYEHLNILRKEWVGYAGEQFPEVHKNIADGLFEEAVDEIVHDNIIDHEKRPDGRGTKELRTILAKTQILPRTHGSGLFYRGETHVLSAVTLGGPGDVQLVEGMEVREKKRFMHHYNFPPFSVGEVKPMRGPARRDIGHGALAERALVAVVPNVTDFPYTIRLVSETLSSNGSSSMGSVCASILAMMDAGVPIKAPVAGIAMGLMLRDEQHYKVLTDIQGPEDHHGDMDFKVAGTKDGITAVQMDVKVDGIPLFILKEAFLQALEARNEIMKVMVAEIAEPRKELSKYAPRIITMHIDPEKIKDVIGPGGKTINTIIALTGAQIDIEQDGTVFITAATPEAGAATEEQIKMLTKEFEIGEIVVGKVTRLFPFGAMIEIAPKREGLVHISQMANFRVGEVTDVMNIGDEVTAQIIEIDDQGRVNLSTKDTMKFVQKEGASTDSRPPRPPHGGDQHHDRRPPHGHDHGHRPPHKGRF
jgi:polyribonucleotide nucleotidyltransferase